MMLEVAGHTVNVQHAGAPVIVLLSLITGLTLVDAPSLRRSWLWGWYVQNSPLDGNHL